MNMVGKMGLLIYGYIGIIIHGYLDIWIHGSNKTMKTIKKNILRSDLSKMYPPWFANYDA